MSALLVFSIMIRLAAAAWSVVIARRIADWRMGFLTLMLVLMASRQTLTLLQTRTAWHLSFTGPWTEWPGLLVSVLGLLAVIFLERLIMDRRRAHAEQRASQALYRSLAEDQPDLICRFQPDGTLTYVNRAYAAYFGGAVEELKGANLFDLVPESDRQRLRDHLAAIRPDRPYAVIEHRVSVPDGEIRWQEWTDRAHFDEQGRAVEFQSVGRDVTRRKRAELALQGNQERFQELLDRLGEVVWAATGDGSEYYYLSAAVEDVYGHPRSAFFENTGLWLDVIHPEDQRRVEEVTRDFFEKGSVSVEYRIVRPDGSIRWLHDRKNVVFDEAGQPLRIGGLATDVTEQKHAEQALRESEKQYRRLFDAASDAIFVIALPSARVVEVNSQATELVGYARDELCTLTLFDLAFSQSRPKIQSVFEEVRQRGRVLFEHHLIRRDGKIVPVEISARLVEHGEGSALLGFVRDISQRRAAEEIIRSAQQALDVQRQREKENAEAQLAEARERLVRQTRLATIGQLTASIAHELRNPLGAIRNAVYYLHRRDPTEAKWKEYLAIIEHQVSAADGIITSLLAMTRAKAPVKQTVDLQAIAREAFQMLHPPGEVEIRYRFPSEPFFVQVDPVQVRQVFVNLFDNAVQAMGRKGCLEVTATRGADFDAVVVRDDGPGVGETDAADIFEPLFTTKARGTGLGLAICRRILELHEGGITLRDTPEGTGAAFEIRLPRSREDGLADRPAAPS